MQALRDGLRRTLAVGMEGAARGLERLAAVLETAMQNDPAHGNVTGATHANYGAKVYGAGRDPSTSTDSQAAIVEALNPGHSATEPITLDGIGMILDSATDYQRKLETEDAGRKAVLGPTLRGSVDDFTRYVAEGSREALR